MAVCLPFFVHLNTLMLGAVGSEADSVGAANYWTAKKRVGGRGDMHNNAKLEKRKGHR
jgi:hypothetical protein